MGGVGLIKGWFYSFLPAIIATVSLIIEWLEDDLVPTPLKIMYHQNI